mmetsp:Transcript_26446/g.47720  ORF Transcript_26446/g.47720 Transcript_26446/m.47720 type:complete len:919 (-) Transcript_26446:34-2790(-)
MAEPLSAGKLKTLQGAVKAISGGAFSATDLTKAPPPPTDTLGGTATSWRTTSSWKTAGPTPLEQVLADSKFGGALLITSACDGSAWELSGPCVKGPKLQVPGGKYRGRSQSQYREQAMIGVEIVTDALMELGVPAEKIEHMDFCNDCDANWDPIVMIPQFWRRHLNSPHGATDALIYYCGPAVETGEWALGWVDQKGQDKVCMLDPDSLLPAPGPNDGVPGTRFVVADAPSTSRMWLRPACRLRGLAAWEAEAMPGGPGGPPLARWLAGLLPNPPTGAQAFLELPPDEGLELLPCHKVLFWGPCPPVSPVMSGHLLWELAEFIGSSTMRIHRSNATKEILLKGGPQILLTILQRQVVDGQQQLALQVLWLLQALAAEAPVHRWAGTMNEALAAALSLPALLCGPGGVEATGNFPELLGAVLGFAGSAAARCPRCREEVSHGGTSKSWPAILKLVTIALSTTVEASALLLSNALEEASDVASSIDTLAADNGPIAAMAASSAAARYACQVVSQAANHRPIGVKDHTELLGQLLGVFSAGVLGGAGQDLSAVAAEALLYATVRNNDCKLELLSQLQQGLQFHFVTALLQSTSIKAVVKALSLVRSLAAAQPSSAVLPGLSLGIVDAVIRCLSKDSKDPQIQRWGLAALGSLCNADEALAKHAAEAGGPSCVVWALGADSLSKAQGVEQESLFCAYSLLRTESGRNELAPSQKGGTQSRLAGLTAGAISRGIREEGGSSEACLWGLRIFERIAQTRARVIAPYVGVILDAMLIQGCLHLTMISGANVVSHLAAVSDVANPKLVAKRVALIKALQTMSHEAALEGTEAGRAREKELLDWVQVFIDILGPPRWPPVEDELPDDTVLDEDDDLLISGSGSKAGSKSRTGTMSRTGTKDPQGSRSATKGGTKDPSGAIRTKSKVN